MNNQLLERILKINQTKNLLDEFSKIVVSLNGRLNNERIKCHHEIVLFFGKSYSNLVMGEVSVYVCPICGSRIYNTDKGWYLPILNDSFLDIQPLILNLESYRENSDLLISIINDEVKNYLLNNYKASVLEIYEYLNSLNYDELLSNKTLKKINKI